MKANTIHQMKIGDSVSIERVFTKEDVLAFANVSGDKNPAHLDEVYAASSAFKEPIAHGMLVSSLFSALLGTQLPGLGTIYTSQTLKFLRPVFLNQKITASITVKEILLDKNRVIFECLAVNPEGKPVLSGEATVLPPQESK